MPQACVARWDGGHDDGLGGALMLFAFPYIVFVRVHRLALDARRRDRTWRYLAYSVVAGLLAAIMLGVLAAMSWVLLGAGMWWLALLLVGLCGLPIVEPVLNRHVFVPLGLVRTSFFAAHVTSMRDSDAYALCMAAWAHASKPTPKGEASIIVRRDKRIPLGDAEIVVTALLAAGRGDAETARMLMRSVSLMVESHPRVRELAGEWLAVDAAERGAWAELAADAAAATFPATTLTYFLEGVAMRKVGAEGAPGVGEIFARWLLAPHRRVTLSLRDAVAKEAVAATPVKTETESESGSGSGSGSGGVAPGNPIGAAIEAHLKAVEGTSATSFANAVNAWDRALGDPATRIWLARRALELDAPLGAADRALREVTSSITDELSRAADTAGLGAPASKGPVGEGLARRLRHGRLDALEASFTRWEQRRHDGAVRAPIDEWRELVALRAAYDAAVGAGGLELRRLAFPHAYLKGTSMAAWLWNSRHEYAISHAISVWLRDEAMLVGDTEAIELCTRNAKLTVPTRS